MNNRANSIINIDLIKEEVVNILKLYNPVVHTNAEEGYGWLCDGGYSITVEKNKKVILWVDLTDEITLGLGGFHEHLDLDLEGYEEFVDDLKIMEELANILRKTKVKNWSYWRGKLWKNMLCKKISS